MKNFLAIRYLMTEIEKNLKTAATNLKKYNKKNYEERKLSSDDLTSYTQPYKEKIRFWKEIKRYLEGRLHFFKSVLIENDLCVHRWGETTASVKGEYKTIGYNDGTLIGGEKFEQSGCSTYYKRRCNICGITEEKQAVEANPFEDER